MMDNFAEAGIYTLLDMHQDVLWLEERKDGFKNGYWGVPPWVKDKINNASRPEPYPYPMAGWPEGGLWACGYFSDRIAKVCWKIIF